MFSDSWVFRFLAEAIFEDNSLDLAEGAFADNSLDLLIDTNRNLQPDDVVRMLRRNTPKEGRDLYEFIAFLTWYGSLLICCIIPAICACRRRRRAMIELEEQILRSTSGRDLPSYYINSHGQWAQLRRGTIQSSNEPLLLMNASTLDGRDITIMATRGNVRRLLAIHEERNGKERMGKVAQLTKYTTMTVTEGDLIRNPPSPRSIADLETGPNQSNTVFDDVNRSIIISSHADIGYGDEIKIDGETELSEKVTMGKRENMNQDVEGGEQVEEEESNAKKNATATSGASFSELRSTYVSYMEDYDDEGEASEFSALVIPAALDCKTELNDKDPMGKWIVPNSCAICLSGYEIGSSVTWSPLVNGEGKLPLCQHAFHTECILTWLSKQNGDSLQCPCCRQDFISSPDRPTNTESLSSLPETMTFENVVISNGSYL
eukprot:scaffold59538_cov59-Attheya_sp.AAC.3